jgi:hypothetical protein
MTLPGRLATALVVVAVSVALPFARTPAGPGRTPAGPGRAPVTASFTAMGLSFRYPATWHPGTWGDQVSSFTAPIVHLSTSPQSDQVPPGGLLVRWEDAGFPGFRLPKPSTTIAGRPAVETLTSGGAWCTALGGTETITVMIPASQPDNWFQMDACLRPPNLAQQEAQVASMLSTVQIADGA